MDLSGLFPLLEEARAFRELVQRLEGGAGEARLVVLEAAQPFFLTALHRRLGQPLLVLVGRPEGARALHEELLAWGTDALLFPEPEALPYERLASDPATVQARLRGLHALSRWRPGQPPPLIVASAPAAARKSPPPLAFAGACQTLRPGMELKPGPALAQWLALGYEAVPSVEAPGTFSRRGGIIDVYPPTSDLPGRIELWGDRVESLRLFHPGTQRSLEPLPSLEITPARELIPPPPQEAAQPGLELDGCRAEARQRLEEEVTGLLEGLALEAADIYIPLFHGGCLLDYLPQGGLLVLEETSRLREALEELDEEALGLRRGQVERGELPANFPQPYLSWPELAARAEAAPRRLLLSPWGEEAARLPFTAAPSFGGRLTSFLQEVKPWLQEGRRLVVASSQASRLAELLEEREVFSPPRPGLGEPPPPGSLTLLQGALAGGWTLDTDHPLTLLSDAEVFGLAKKKRRGRRRSPMREELLGQLTPGDYVVHVEHGIARFGGMVRLGQDGAEREYLALEYAAGDRLYVPTDQVDRLSRYIGPGGYAPPLTRLGTQEWARAKQRVREAAAELARDLLGLYAARDVAQGFAFSLDTPWQREMEASFPYVETPDQLRAVREVKADMQQPRPMDRLVCGDVGYGKTEVALRAAFKAAMDGAQVAVLVPTTVLAQQHYHTFRERLGAFPVAVEMLSRFRSPREQREVLAGLARGSVDICIGTHRLLQKDVAFKNLGLVIVDEEQRFGVAHKERLKQMRREVDVLTLSATPIPRTLHLALVGLRDMSTMETPPEERLPIKTYVSEYNDRLAREAILRELERGGQVYFVHNRVESIGYVARRLEELVPQAQIAVAHGQMPEEALERVMLDFASGHYDVLACTTIIESGLDMPNVNTLIVNSADRLGLSQLYQLRGRVGRGSERAYAYFFYEKGKRLTEAAEKRLRTIFEATELGAGFRIAMKDLEIRGAGNLLGPEQSGHIGAVGFDLYCRLLAEAVEELRGRPRPGRPPPPPSIDLPLPAFIPEGYIPDPGSRLELYQRLALIAQAQAIDDLTQEMADRFGPLPEPVADLLYLVRLKVAGARAGVGSIRMEEGQAVVQLRPGMRLDPRSISRHRGPGVRVGSNQVRLDLEGPGWKERLMEIIGALGKG